MKTLHPFAGGRSAIAASLLLIAMLVSGCATPGASPSSRIHATTAARMGEITRTAALPADITLNSLGAGGVAERRDDWTEQARAHARQTLETIRPERIVYVHDLETRDDLADEIAHVRALFELVDLNLLLSYAPAQMLPPTALGRFDYSVGSIDRILEAADADALLLVRGVDDIFATDRKALAVAGLILAAAVGAGYNMSSGEAHLSAALIARDGTILWYDWLETPNGLTMRETTYVALAGESYVVIRYRAPERHYHERDAGDFERIVASIQIEDRPGKS